MASFISAVVLMAAGSALAATSTATATGVEQPTQMPSLGSPTTHGCYSSSGSLTFNNTIKWNTIGSCATDTCLAMNKNVGATMGGNQCWCGDEYPPLDTLVDDKNCNVGCSGFDQFACGGLNFWTVYNTGLTLVVSSSPNSTSSSSSSSAGASQTPTSTGPSSSSSTTSAADSSKSSSDSGSKHSSTAGIAAGTVVGVVAAAGIAGGIYFYIRRRRNHELESAHRRNAAVNAFIYGSKPGSSAGHSDSRLDPVMVQRRLSDGSIADNQDYSRKILRVTNA